MESLVSSFEYNRDYLDEASRLLEKILDRKIRSRLIEEFIILIEIHNGERWVSIVNEGFGVNPLIHLLFQLTISPENSLLLIEEPEIHLHPAAQSRLSGVLIDAALERNNQLILTTHAEHILFGFLENIYNKKINHNQLKIHFFERRNGKSSTVNLPVSMNGEIKGGMKGFFEVDLRHLQKFYQSIQNYETSS